MYDNYTVKIKAKALHNLLVKQGLISPLEDLYIRDDGSVEVTGVNVSSIEGLANALKSEIPPTEYTMTIRYPSPTASAVLTLLGVLDLGRRVYCLKSDPDTIRIKTYSFEDLELFESRIENIKIKE